MPPSPASRQASEAKSAGGATEGALSRLGELGWQALPAIGSAIGFAGFVAVVGAAVEWIRFDAAHLPATQAVLALPKQELVIIGALALAAFVLGAVLALLLVYLINSNGDATRRTAWGLVAVGVIEMWVALIFLGVEHKVVDVVFGVWVLVVGLSAADVVGAVMSNFTHRSMLARARVSLVQARDALEAASTASRLATTAARKSPSPTTESAREQAVLAVLPAQRQWERALREWQAAHEALLDELPSQTGTRLREDASQFNAYMRKPPSGVRLEQSLRLAEKDMSHVFLAVAAHLRAQLALGERFAKLFRDGLSSSVFTVSIVLAIVLLVYGVVRIVTESAFSWVAILLAVTTVLTMMNLFVARATEKFAWYGVSVFFSVLLFGAALTIARTLHAPSVQPVALVRKGDDVGICGVYITQTNERVYVGRLASPGYRPGLIFWVPTSDVELVDVGQLERIDSRFPKLAVAMLRRLYRDRAEEAAPALKNTTVATVTNGAKAGDTTTTTSEVPPSTTPRPTPFPSEGVGASCTS
jgi:hypothetical protein